MAWHPNCSFGLVEGRLYDDRTTPLDLGHSFVRLIANLLQSVLDAGRFRKR